MALGLVVGFLAVGSPALGQNPPGYGGTKVDCYVNFVNAPSPMHRGVFQNVTVKGGNHGTSRGNCRISLQLRKGNLIGQATGPYDLFVPIGGTFTASFGAKPTELGVYSLRGCAHGRAAISIHPADDCKTIYRNVVA
jgi:hypothetical protein